MEIPTVWQLHPHIGEEKYQMLELNKRLESYLGRVKLLEEENQLLRGEIQALQRNRDTKGQIQVHEEALNLARREVQAAWMKKDRAELEVSNLVEEMEALNAQRQKERAAQAEAKRKLAEYKKMLEDEWRMQIWLREQAAHLEKEVSLQVQVHQEEMASLKSTSAVSKPILLPPQHGQNISLQGLGEEYSQRAAQAWQEAAGVYQRQVEQLEDSLNRARAQMAQINQEKKENQLYVQDLAKELESTKVKRELLEKNIAQQRERQNQELQQLQVQVEALESEKVDLGEQIGDLLDDTRDLLQTKMSLGLEVATYRALLDTESLRVNSQSTRKTSVRTESLLGVLSKPHGIHPDTQTISASSLLSSLLTTSRSITHSKANLMTPTRSWSLTQSTQDTPKTGQNGEKEEGISKGTATFQRTSIATSTKSLTGTGLVPFTPKKVQEKVGCTTAVSDYVVPPAVDEPDSILSAQIKEDLEEPTLGAHVKEDLEEPTLGAHVKEDLEEPTLGAHVKEDLEEPTLGAHVKEVLEERTLGAHVKEDLKEPTLGAHVKEDLEEPTLGAHVKEVLEEPTLGAHVKEDLEEPTLGAHVKEDLEEPTLGAHVEEDLEEPTLGAHVKEDLEELTLGAHVKEDLEEPTLGAHVKEDLEEPTLGAHVKEDLEEPTLGAHVKEDLEEPTLGAHVKEALKEPTLGAHVKEDLEEPTLDAHVKEALEEPTLGAHVKEDLQEPTLGAHVKEDLEEPTLGAHVKEVLEEPTLGAHVKEDLEEPTLGAHVKEDLEEPTLGAHVKEDLEEPTLGAHVEEDLEEPTLGAHVKEDLEELTLGAHVKEDLEEPTLGAHVKKDLEEPTLGAHVKEDLEEPTLGAHVKEALEEPTLSAHVKEDLQEPTFSEHVTEDLQEILTENQSKARQDTSSPEEAALISLPAGHLSSIPQTPEGEVPSNLHTEDTKGSEDGEEEETEVSTEMAQISHAPMFSWEENDTAIPEEKDVVSELELESENTSENYMQECRTDNRFKLTDLKQLGEDSENPALPLYEQTSLHSVDAFSHDGKKREIITWEDNAKESVSNIPGMESLKSAPEVEKQSIERWEEVDTIEEIEDEAEVEHCGTDEQDCHHSDVELQEKETKNDSETEESKVEVKKEQKVSDGEEDKVEEEQKMDEHIAVIDEISANTGKEPIIQGSSALELKVDLHRNSEHTEETTDLVVDTYQDDHLLVEDHAEEQIQSDEDESLNISASWRTDLGEADSYAQENTLADTRPLIHYKSDEEADANTQASHMGVSDSEEEREKYEEVLMWSQNIAKRFDTMEDLSEQPENAYPDDVVLEESAQTVVEENIDEITKEDPVEPVSEDILQGKITDVDINVDLLKDDTLVDLVENDFMDREESIQGVEETEKKNQVLLVQEQEESSGLQNWSQRFVSETEQHALPFEQPATGEDDIVITNDNTESCNMESFVQIKSEGEGESGMKTHSDYFPLVTDKPQLEPSQEQALEEESHEMSSTEITYSDVFPTESNLTEEQVFTKEEEDKQSNMSMFSHADFTDNLSQHSGLNSRPESQSNIANSDLEESNSSEDESPNASQCSQLLSHTAMSTKLLDFSNTATSGDVSKHDSVSFTGLMEEVMKGRFEKDSVENYSTSQEAEWESVSQNKEEEQLSVDNSSSRMHGNNSSLPQMQEWKDIDYPDITGASNNILSGITIEDNKASEKEDIFQGRVLNEEPQTKEKENDLHSFFTSSIKEDIWSATKFEMAATFDSNEPIDTTHTIHPNQSMTFEEDWGDLGSLKAANGKEMSMSTAQSEEEEKREEQEMSQAKQLQCQDVKGGQVETVQSDDSVDDGDSWSSGEE